MMSPSSPQCTEFKARAPLSIIPWMPGPRDLRATPRKGQKHKKDKTNTWAKSSCPELLHVLGLGLMYSRQNDFTEHHLTLETILWELFVIFLAVLAHEPLLCDLGYRPLHTDNYPVLICQLLQQHSPLLSENMRLFLKPCAITLACAST